MKVAIFEKDTDPNRADFGGGSTFELEDGLDVVLEGEMVVFEHKALILKVKLRKLPTVRDKHIGLDHEDARVEVAVLFDQVREEDAAPRLANQRRIYRLIILEL